MEKEGKEWKAVYFEEKDIEETGERVYIFNGKYWEDRAKRDWSKLPKIFD
jgi:hypothetical protein